MKDFIIMSRYAGMREDLVQAGGGNSSVKLDKNTMQIKASGYQLADITYEDGFATVDPQIIIDFFNFNKIEDIKKEQEQEVLDKAFVKGKKPSIETFLHAITDKYTLHTHPMLVNILTARRNGFDVLRKLYPNALFVDYATPGIELAKEYFKEYLKCRSNENQIFDIIFLKNHGLIVSGKNGAEVIAKTEEVICKISDYLKIDITKDLITTKLYNLLSKADIDNNDIVYLSNHRKIQEYIAQMPEGLWDYTFCPDCIVYCGKKILWMKDMNDLEAIKTHIQQYGKPIVIVIDKQVYIIAQSVKKAKEIECVLAFSAEVLLYNKEHRIELLNDSEQDFLLNWDSEKYRKNMR